MGMQGLDSGDFPPVFVSPGNWDDMGAILDRLGVAYQQLADVSLADRESGVVMLNCGSSWYTETDGDTLDGFVRGGGSLLASDLASDAVSELTDASFVDGDWGSEVDATVVDPELRDLLGRERLTLDFDTAIKAVDSLPAGANPLLRTTDDDTVIAYQESHGAGEVVYTSFHNHSQSSEVEDALLSVLLMVPIAESAGTTVTETYTTVVGEDPTDDDGGATGSDTAVYGDATPAGDTEVFGEADARADAHTSGDASDAVTVHLRAASGGEGALQRTLRPGDSVRLGRGDLQGVADDDALPYVSGTHLELRYPEDGTGDRLEIRDCDSTNGTVLDGRDISGGDFHPLEPGTGLTLADDRVTFGIGME